MQLTNNKSEQATRTTPYSTGISGEKYNTTMDERLHDLQLHLLHVQIAIAHPLQHLPEAMSTGVTLETNQNEQ